MRVRPPMWDVFSIRVMLVLGEYWPRWYAAEEPAAPAPFADVRD